jgi:hypothetical protein
MATYQIGEQLTEKDLRVKGVQNEYNAQPESPYLKPFFAKYSSQFLMNLERGNEAPCKPLVSQEQEQEQEHIQEQEQEQDSFAAEKPAPPEKNSNEVELQNACKQTWKSYSDAFFNRYGTDPVRNAKVNGQVKQFVKRIGFTESPLVAASFVLNNTQYYLQRGHSVDCLLADAEKIRTEWATGNVMTTTRANQIDKSQANKSAVTEAMQLLGATS